MERRGFEDPARGVKSLCNIGQKRDEKKRKKNITCIPANGAMAAVGGLREGCDGGVVACVPADGVVWSSLLRTPWWWSPCNGGGYDNGSSTTLKEEKVK